MKVRIKGKRPIGIPRNRQEVGTGSVPEYED
jgi:hypothetical protein